MAIKKCKECGKDISTKAKKCPSCGAPTTKNISTGTGCLIIILLIIGVVVMSPKTKNKNETPPTINWKTKNNSSMAYIMMEDFVKKRLKSPSTADFPGVFEGNRKHITSLGGQKYRIYSYVDSQNSFGAMIRTKFNGEIMQIDKNNWQLLSLNID